MLKVLRLMAITIAVAAALLLAGCTQESPSVIRVDISGPVANLDPQFATDPAARMIIANLFEGLVVQDSDGRLSLGAAAGYNISVDGLTYTFTLRDDIYWQDGSAVSAQDFVFAFRRMFSPYASSPFAGDFLVIANATRVMEGMSPPATLGVRALGAQTLIFALERPCPGFLSSLAHTAAMPCNRYAFEQSVGRYGLEARYLFSNGPFTIGRWDGSQLHLNRSEYFREEGQALSERVVFYIGRQDHVRQFLDGRSDMVLVPSDRLIEVTGRPAQLIPAQTTVWGLVFNQNTLPWGNTLLRQGLALTLDLGPRSEYLPANLVATGVFIPPGTLVQTQSFREGADAHMPSPPDNNHARRLFGRGLAVIGYDHLPLTTIFVPESHATHLEFLSETWRRELGAEITIEIGPNAQSSQRLAIEEYPIALLPFYSTNGAPGAFLSFFHSDVNRYGYNSPRFDHALSAAGLAVNANEIIYLYQQAEGILLEDAAIIPLFFETSYYALATGLAGVDILPFGGGARFQNAQRG